MNWIAKAIGRNTAGTMALGAMLALAGCGGEEAKKPAAPETVSGLRVAAVRLETVPLEIEAPGTVASVNSAPVAARTMGTVTRVAVREGDSVRAGELLVSLDERELAARRSAALSAVEEARAAREEAARMLAAAEAQAEVTQKTFERFDFLRKQNSVSAQEFDEVAAKQKAAQAQLAAARAKQQQVEALYARAQSEARAAETVAGYAHVLAPFSGTVVRRNVEPGQLATPGMPLVVLEDSSRYRLEVTLDATAAAALRRGTRARVRLDALPEKSLEAVVTELEAGADPGSHTVRARLELPREPGIRSGLFGRAWFQKGETQAIVLPPDAIVHRGQLHGVYAVGDDGVARFRLVTLGRTLADGRVEILSGLSEKDRVVLNAGTRELDGRKVG
jgi:RND family efflux transporter MFP subunit